jgi:hypothetical protein
MDISTQNEDTRFLELLQKWQSGDFTRADEQEMNALAASDAFRREALEGILDFPTHDQATAILSLRQKIAGKSPRHRVLFAPIMALAAALALIFGAIWFFNIRPIPVDNGQVAQELPTAPTEIPQPAATPPVTATPGNSNPRLDAVPTPSKAMEQNSRETESYSALESDDTAVDRQVSAAPEAKKDIASTPQAPGVIVDQSTNVARPQEIAEESATRSAKKKSAAAKPVPSYDEGAADKAKAGKSALAAQPLGGWDAFRLYLSTNARLTAAARANNVSGTVRLRFQLNDKQQPADFKVIQGLGFGCDEEAIRLVKNFSWVSGDNQPITVDVPFVR